MVAKRGRAGRGDGLPLAQLSLFDAVASKAPEVGRRAVEVREWSGGLSVLHGLPVVCDDVHVRLQSHGAGRLHRCPACGSDCWVGLAVARFACDGGCDEHVVLAAIGARR